MLFLTGVANECFFSFLAAFRQWPLLLDYSQKEGFDTSGKFVFTEKNRWWAEEDSRRTYAIKIEEFFAVEPEVWFAA
jgi:hypothetical protein